MPRHVLITGHSRGLGHGFAAACLARGWTVHGLSRHPASGLAGALREVTCDLADPAAIAPALTRLLDGVDALDLALLNAGVLGPIADLAETPVAELEAVMRVNVWANKHLLDWLLARSLPVAQVVLLSSGAAVRGNRGWGAYALSKATLNMLAQLYAHEFPHGQLLALAPGYVDTGMQAVLCDPEQTDGERFPSLQRLRAARGTDAMPDPRTAAERILDLLPGLADRPSGSFVDVRAP